MAKSMADRVARLQEQKQAALEKAKAADEILRKLRAEQDRKARADARKARNRALIQTGALVEITGLLGADKGMLLGGLYDLAKVIKEAPEKAGQWKQAGDAEIARREAEKKKDEGLTKSGEEPLPELQEEIE